jgi:FMN phosphatase YigB (HAD superfamily)
MEGKITAADLAVYLAAPIPLSAAEILAGLYVGFRSLPFNPAVWALAVDQPRRGRKRVLVTGNREVFTEIVVPFYGLDQVFDVLVNSSDYGERSKEVLWPIAFEQRGPG